MNSDLISRSALRKAVNGFYDNSFKGIVSSDLIKYAEAVDELIDNAPTVEPCTDCCESMKQAISEFNANYRKKGKWIPVKYRPLTTEERIEFAEHYGIEYCDTVDEKTFDCPMPEDGQEILISGSWGISIDVADNDIDGEGFVVYGLEGNGDWEGIDAWMPLPEPYTRGDV